jgi:hypothetical protein
MKTHWKILLGFCVVAAVVALAAIARHYQLKMAVAHYRAELKAKGEPMDLAQVIPPPVPPEQNSAAIFLKASVLIETNPAFFYTNTFSGKQMVAPGKAMVRAAQPDISEPGKYGFTNSWDEAFTAVKQNAEALSLLHKIIENPKLDFHIPYARGFVDGGFFTNMHLIELKKSAHLLSSAAIVDLHRGNTGEAVENVRVILAIASAMQDQRLEISELVRIAIAAIMQNPTWEILQSNHATEKDLAALQKDWERLDFVQSYKNALTMERLIGDVTLTQWRKFDTEFDKYFRMFASARQSLGVDDADEPTFYQRMKFSTEIFLWRHWWSYADELRSLRGGEVLMETARCAETNSAFSTLLQRQQAGLDALGLNDSLDKLSNPFLLLAEPDFHSLLSESVITMSGCFKRVMAIETARRMTVAAIALKRYQLKHGNYPPDLNSLVPEFFAAVPLDPVDGKPLRYKLNSDGTFLLYSIGENGVDDGGNPALEKGVESSSFNWQNPHALDWVWPQPATGAEIQKYYDERGKKSD